jgi:DNA recombination protein RmuC
MSISAALLVVAVAALAISVWAFVGARRREEAQNSALRQEMQSLVNAHSQAVTAQFAHLSQTLTSQLAEVTHQVQGGMASVGTLATGAQQAVAEQLRASTNMLGTIRQQLGEVQMKSHELSDAARHLETVLGGAKTRGTLGEIALDRMLADALPPSTYETQFRFSTGEVVDAVVRLRDKLLPIDSKFPLDDYRRLAEVGEEARKGFSSTVRQHADSIARKYILPGEGTLDIALMFVPSEGVYYELLRSEDSKGLPLDEYCRSKGIVPVSPSTLFAHLKIIFVGLRGMQLEENVDKILASLSALKKQVEGFGEVYEKLGTHLRNAQQSYSDADRKLLRTRDALDGALDQLAQGAPPTKALEAASRD